MISKEQYGRYIDGTSGGSLLPEGLPISIFIDENEIDMVDILRSPREVRAELSDIFEPEFVYAIQDLYRGLIAIGLNRPDIFESVIDEGLTHKDLLLCVLSKQKLREASVTQPYSLNSGSVIDFYDESRGINILINPQQLDVIDESTPQFIDTKNLDKFLNSGRTVRQFLAFVSGGTPSFFFMDVAYDKDGKISDVQIKEDLDYEEHGWLIDFGNSK